VHKEPRDADRGGDGIRPLVDSDAVVVRVSPNPPRRS
jgi:hypothetical protein